MNIRKEKLELYKAVYTAFESHLQNILSEEQSIILRMYLVENKGLMEIAEHLHFSSYHIVKEELRDILTILRELA